LPRIDEEEGGDGAQDKDEEDVEEYGHMCQSETGKGGENSKDNY
jgi:hypothetical protein